MERTPGGEKHMHRDTHAAGRHGGETSGTTFPLVFFIGWARLGDGLLGYEYIL